MSERKSCKGQAEIELMTVESNVLGEDFSIGDAEFVVALG